MRLWRVAPIHFPFSLLSKLKKPIHGQGHLNYEYFIGETRQKDDMQPVIESYAGWRSQRR